MRRLVCVVEGHGEAIAAPVLCNRVLRELLGVRSGWYVDELPVRQPRSRLVDMRGNDSRRQVNALGMSNALQLAATRGPTGILVLCDADDDCPATWSRTVPEQVQRGDSRFRVRCVMAAREFESWFLWGRTDHERRRVRAIDPERSPRDAKAAISRLVDGGYRPSSGQLSLVRSLPIGRVWARSDSFDKLVRSIAELVDTAVPLRPGR